MDAQTLQYVEIVNRLKRGTQEGKVLWERTGSYGHQYTVPLDNGHHALVASAPSGQAVLFTMTSAQGVQTLYLDSARVTEDILRLALLAPAFMVIPLPEFVSFVDGAAFPIQVLTAYH